MDKEIKDTEIKDKEVVEEVKEEPKEEVYTAEELEKKLQSETDRRVTEALKTAKSKWEEEYDQKLKEEKRLAELSAEEKEQELLKIKEQEIAEREVAIKRKELELDAVNVLADKKLPVSFVGMVVGEDAEQTQANINILQEEWNAAIQEEMKKKVSNSQFKRSTASKSADLGEKLAKANKEKKVDHNWF